jgi:hypothetical protein
MKMYGTKVLGDSKNKKEQEVCKQSQTTSEVQT